MLKQKIPPVILGLSIILLSSSIQIHAAEDVPFKDVPQDHPSYSFVKLLSEQGIISGNPDGTFRPDENMKIGEFFCILDKLVDDEEITAQIDEKQGETTSHWAYKSSEKMVQKYQLSIGDLSSETLNSPVTKMDVICTTVKEFGLTDPSAASRTLYNPFRGLLNIKAISDHDYYICAYHLGIIDLPPDATVHTKGTITRGEACDIIVKTINRAEEGSLNIRIPIELQDINYQFIGENADADHHIYGIGETLYKFSPELVKDLAETGTLIVTAEDQDKYDDYDFVIDGLYFPGSNQIVLFTKGGEWNVARVSFVLAHEIGHFIWDECLTPEDRNVIRASYRSDDLDRIIEIASRDYGNTNPEEYFSEIIGNYMDDKKREKIDAIGMDDVTAIVRRYVKDPSPYSSIIYW